MYSTYDMVGEYTGNLVLLTDLEDNPEVNIPVSITVLGAPNIMVGLDELNFGEVIVGDTVSADLMIGNNGTEILEITSVVANDPDGAFVSTDQTGSLEPGEELHLEVIYMPTTVGPDDGTVVISSNDPNEAEYSLSLVAEVIPAPVFVLSEESITVDMVSYAQDTTELYISNLGDGVLEYSVEIGGDVLYETETFTKEDYADWSLKKRISTGYQRQSGLPVQIKMVFSMLTVREAMTGMDHTVHNGDGVQLERKTDTNTQTGKMLCLNLDIM